MHYKMSLHFIVSGAIIFCCESTILRIILAMTIKIFIGLLSEENVLNSLLHKKSQLKGVITLLRNLHIHARHLISRHIKTYRNKETCTLEALRKCYFQNTK